MKVAIYSRKSKYTGVGDSIENQIQMCKDYANSKYTNTELEFDIYEDEGFSGGNINRPEFKRLMKNIKQYNVLICYRLDRISRNVADFSSTLDILQVNNCDFVSIKEQFDTSSPMGRAMIYIASVFAQLERETIAERVRDNMLEMAKNGRWTGGRTPLGYASESSTYFDTEGNERKIVKLVKNEEELKLVKLIYETYLKEGSLHKTEVWFTQHNVKSNTGILLEKTSLKLILQNPVYVKSSDDVIEYMESSGWNVYGNPDGIHGLLSYNKTEGVTVDGKSIKRVKDKSEWIAAISNVEGVIDSETWLDVQKQFDTNRDTFPRLGKTNTAILTGKLKCSCGSNMVVTHGGISKKTGSQIYYYLCSMKRKSKGVICNSKNVNAEEIENAVISQLEELGKSKKSFLEQLKEQNKEITKNKTKDTNRLNIEKKIREKKKQIDNLVNKLSIDDSIADILIDKIKVLKEEVKALELDLSKINDELELAKEEEVNLSYIEMLLNKCIDIKKYSKDEQKELIHLLVDDIEYDGNTRDVDINIIGSKKK